LSRQPEDSGATGDTHDNLRDQGHDKMDTLYNSRNTKALAAVLHQIKFISLYCCAVHFEDSLSIAHQQMH
jgi:hypothetical protein